VLVQGRYPSSTAEQIATNLRHTVSEAVLLPDGASVVPSISVGLAAYPEAGRSAAELMKAADQDMYTHKRAGRSSAQGEHTPPRSQRTDHESGHPPQSHPD